MCLSRRILQKKPPKTAIGWKYFDVAGFRPPRFQSKIYPLGVKYQVGKIYTAEYNGYRIYMFGRTEYPAGFHAYAKKPDRGYSGRGLRRVRLYDIHTWGFEQRTRRVYVASRMKILPLRRKRAGN